MPRSQFDQELNKMHVDLDRMCHLVVLAIENVLQLLRNKIMNLPKILFMVINKLMMWKDPLKQNVYL